MTTEQYLKRLTSITTWQRGGVRAPHKPLLILLTLSQLLQGHARLRPTQDIFGQLLDLLRTFGPPRKIHHPEQPMARLPKERLWEIRGLQGDIFAYSGKQVDRKTLNGDGVTAGFPEDVHDLLSADPACVKFTIEHLLQTHFPESLHEEILDALQLKELPLAEQAGKERKPAVVRDPAFRHNVIKAYERRCAICDFDIRIQDQMMGLEAAHIRWRASGGPDIVTNGLALCVVHHRALDRGGISLDRDLKVLVSEDLYGVSEAWDFWFSRFENRPIRPPRNERNLPHPDYIDWHRREVFRETE